MTIIIQPLFMSMNTDKLKQLCADRLTNLETQLAELLTYCEQLRLENQSLRAREIELPAERDGSIQRNEPAHSQTEAMRLESLENPDEQ